MVFVTLDSRGFDNWTLPHEGGHIVKMIEDTMGYYKRLEAAGPDYSCQDPKNADNPISEMTLQWEEDYRTAERKKN